MRHALKGKKQTEEHVRRKAASCRKTFALHPKPLLDMKRKLEKKYKVNKNGCWVWIGSIFFKKTGSYGQMRIGRKGEDKLKRAHRISYETFVGEIPETLELDHLCRNTLCINPEHLEPVTHAENMRRKIC